MHTRRSLRGRIVLACCLPAALASAQPSPESTYTSFLGMGARLVEINEPHKATLFYRNAASLLPERAEAYREMSRTLLSIGEVSEAAFWWFEASRRAPGDAVLGELRSRFPEHALDESSSGTVQRIEVRYVGRSDLDGAGGGGGSIDAGSEVSRKLLFTQAYDASGRRLSRFEPEWSGVDGTKETPSPGEKIVARDPASGKTGEVSLRVIGKTAALRLFDVSTRKEIKEALYVAPGERRSLRVLAQDAAGNALALKEYRWSAEKDGVAAPEVLQTDLTYSSPEFPFEPVANVFRSPAVREPTPFGLVVTDPATGVRARAEVVVAPDVAKVAASREAVRWIDRLEDALREGDAEGKLVLVEFQAPW
jgi:hypothetical protein